MTITRDYKKRAFKYSTLYVYREININKSRGLCSVLSL